MVDDGKETRLYFKTNRDRLIFGRGTSQRRGSEVSSLLPGVLQANTEIGWETLAFTTHIAAMYISIPTY
jgi:hypothetical protein